MEIVAWDHIHCQAPSHVCSHRMVTYQETVSVARYKDAAGVIQEVLYE